MRSGAVAALVVASAVVAGGAVYITRIQAVESAHSRLEAASADRSALQTELGRQTEHAERLADRLQKARARIERLRAANQPGPLFQYRYAPFEKLTGRYYGGIMKVETGQGRPSLIVDLAEFFTGEEADRARAEDGYPGEDLDYYVRNVNPKLRTFLLDHSADITLATWDRHNIPVEKPVEVDTFIRIFTRPKPWEQNVLSNGYWITVTDGIVTKLEEQYVP